MHSHERYIPNSSRQSTQIISFQIKRYGNVTLAHLHLGDEAELVFDLQEDGVEGQLVGLLVESGQSRSGLGQQAGVARALLLQRKGRTPTR